MKMKIVRVEIADSTSQYLHFQEWIGQHPKEGTAAEPWPLHAIPIGRAIPDAFREELAGLQVQFIAFPLKVPMLPAMRADPMPGLEDRVEKRGFFPRNEAKYIERGVDAERL